MTGSTASAVEVVRPLWRRFSPRFIERAFDHVAAGGLAAVVHSETRIEAYFGVDQSSELAYFARWALASIEHSGVTARTEGGEARLRKAVLDGEQALSVLDWCDRDSVHPGSTRTMTLDCVACTACCQHADVIIEPGDLERLRAYGRAELADATRYRRDPQGRLHLRFDGPRCGHLEASGACAIYEARFEACRQFPPGSEPCLAAREDTLDIRDDSPDHVPMEENP